MYVEATITCKCNCMFQTGIHKSPYDVPPKCPQCNAVMDIEAWHRLLSATGELADFNTEMLKNHTGLNEPLMLASALTVKTLPED